MGFKLLQLCIMQAKKVLTVDNMPSSTAFIAQGSHA